jgi:hypothetical protein
VLSEQHDEWQVGKRYFGAGSLAKPEWKEEIAKQPQLIDRVGSLWRENALTFASEVGKALDRRDLTTRRFVHRSPEGIGGVPLYTVFEERSTKPLRAGVA